MKKMKKYASGILAALALTVSSVSSQAQTTNLMVYNFNNDTLVYGGGSSWGNWFGGIYQGAFWDSTQDSSNNPSSGALMVNLLCTGGDQYVLWDGENPGYTADITTTFTNLSFDIRYDISSAIRTNTSAAGVDGSRGVGSLDFGDMRVGSSKNYDQEWFYYFSIPATNALDQPNTNWVHISIPLNKDTVLNNNPALTTFNDILFGIDGGNYGNHVLVGNQIYWLDNIQFIGPKAGIPLPPPVMGIKPVTEPALRLFGGSGGQYSRSQLTTLDQNQSWIGVSSYPVSYSFTVLSVPTTPGNLDMHIFFEPLTGFTETINNNHDMDYHMPNLLWLRIQGGTGSDSCTADISWKTNSGYNNPSHKDLQITNPKAVGTWTITFNSASTGTLTAPGASPAPFTLSDPNIETDFANPMLLSFGNQCNGVSANQGVANDWAKISVSGVSGVNETNDFTKETSIDPLVWDISNSNTKSSVVLVTTNDHYWVTWSSPSTGYGLGVSSSLTGTWQLPEYYNSYATGTNSVPYEALQGTLNWALIPANCLPTVDGLPHTGQALSKNAFFRLSNPPPPQN
jgi:hypothetical protein